MEINKISEIYMCVCVDCHTTQTATHTHTLNRLQNEKEKMKSKEHKGWHPLCLQLTFEMIKKNERRKWCVWRQCCTQTKRPTHTIKYVFQKIEKKFEKKEKE